MDELADRILSHGFAEEDARHALELRLGTLTSAIAKAPKGSSGGKKTHNASAVTVDEVRARWNGVGKSSSSASSSFSSSTVVASLLLIFAVVVAVASVMFGVDKLAKGGGGAPTVPQNERIAELTEAHSLCKQRVIDEAASCQRRVEHLEAQLKLTGGASGAAFPSAEAPKPPVDPREKADMSLIRMRVPESQEGPASTCPDGDLVQSTYPNRVAADNGGYLFLDPPRAMATTERTSFRVALNLHEDFHWRWVKSMNPDNMWNISLYWTDRKILTPLPKYLMHNHIIGEGQLIVKNRLAYNLRVYYQNNPHIVNEPIPVYPPNPQYKPETTPLALTDIHPESYIMNKPEDCFRFFFGIDHAAERAKGTVWISKETENSQGEGIVVFTDINKDLRPHFEVNRDMDICKRISYPKLQSSDIINGEVIQRYIKHPMLLKDRKSETRMYLLYASINPFILLTLKEGTVRLNSMPYENDDYENVLKHLTNVKQQEGHEAYEKIKDSLKWNYDMLDEYLFEQKRVPDRGWVRNVLRPRMNQYIVRVFNSTKHLLGRRNSTGHIIEEHHSFALFGVDFILNENLVPTLTEVQGGPGMAIGGIKTKIIVPMLLEAIDIVSEIQHRKRFGLPLRNLEAPAVWEEIVNEAEV